MVWPKAKASWPEPAGKTLKIPLSQEPKRTGALKATHQELLTPRGSVN